MMILLSWELALVPNAPVQLRLRQVNVVRGEPDRRSRQLEPVLGPALVTNPTLREHHP